MSSSRFCAFLFLYNFITGDALNYSGKSYYFKTNSNNEFTVYNRIHFLNHNITDFNVNPHPPPFRPQHANVVKNLVNTEHHKHVNLSTLYLDNEWNYDHKERNKTNLPVLVKKIYENRLKDPNRTNTNRILFNTNNNSSSKIIKFNLDSLKAHENVTDAEMYFYWPLENSSSIYKTSVVLRLYQYEKQLNNQLNMSNLIENPDIHKLFNVIYISKAQKGWQTFKLKKPIDNWSKGEENLGLLLTISSYDDNKLISIYNDTNKGMFRTFAVLNIQRNGTNNQYKTNATKPIKDHQPTNDSSSPLSSYCSRKPWQVDFRSFQWDKFILYPEDGFNAYHCAGRCQFDESFKNLHIMNNHALLRKLSDHGYHSNREKLCCVATKFSSIPVMYFDRFENIALKNYDGMVVRDCSCR